MKGWISCLVSVLLLAAPATAQASRSELGGDNPQSKGSQVTIEINDHILSIPEAMRPFVLNGRTMFPLRYISEWLGAQVDWGYPDGSGQIAWVQTQDTLLGFPIDQNAVYFDGELVMVDQGGVLHNGYTFVPIRHVVSRIGGDIAWEEATRTVHIAYEPVHDPYSTAYKCALHDTDYFAGTCKENRFLLPQAYTAFGLNDIKTLTQYSLLNDANRAYLNRLALLHGGGPPKTTTEAIHTTINQVIADIIIAETIGTIWVPAAAVEMELEEGQTLANAFKAPARSGWASNTQYMTERAIRWQSEVSGRIARLLGDGEWEIEEYGYVSEKGSYWFDGLEEGTLLDAKVIPQKWIANGRLADWAENGPLPKMLGQMDEQIRVVAGHRPIEWRVDTVVGRDALVTSLQRMGRADILQKIQFR